jgi:uncharacterized protein
MLDQTALVVALVFLLAGFVKGVIGLGLPTVAMGLMALVLPPAQAAAMLVVPSLITNVWQMLAGPNLAPIARRLGAMMLAAAIATLAGAGLLTGAAARYAPPGLGIALIIYAVLGLASVRFSIRPEREPWLSPIVGAVTGLVTAATGVFVVPGLLYLQALGLEKDDLVQALGLAFTVSTVALAANLLLSGAFPASIAGASLLALGPALAGMYLGQVARARMRETTFRRVFFISLLLLGAYLIGRALF